MRGGCFCGRTSSLDSFVGPPSRTPRSHHGFRLYRRMGDGDVGLSQRETKRKLENDGHLRHRGSRHCSSNEGLVCHVRRTREQRGHGLLSGIRSTLKSEFECHSSVAPARRRSLSRTASVKSAAGRISNGPAFTPGCFDINWIAWFRSLASRTRIPPNCSFVSA